MPDGAVIVAPDGLEANDGSSIEKPTTLTKAIGNATTGTVIVMRGGTYLTGNHTFNKSITIQPYLNEKPVIKGSKIANEWTKEGAYWVTTWANLFNFPTPGFHKEQFGARRLWRGDAVFMNDKMLKPVDALSQIGPGLFYCDYESNKVYLVDDPAGIKIFNQSVNFTVRNNLIENNNANAIWYDVGHRNGHVYNNYFRNNGQHISVEISHKVYIANNVFQGNRVQLLNSANGEVYNNTFINCYLRFKRGNRGAGNDQFGWHASSGPGPENYHGHKAANNIFAGTSYVWYDDNNTLDMEFQTEVFAHQLFLTESRPIQAAYNAMKLPLTNYNTLDDYRAVYGDFEYGSEQLSVSQEQLFQSPADGDYRLKITGTPEGIPVPDSIAARLGWEPVICGVGAFAQTPGRSNSIQVPEKSGGESQLVTLNPSGLTILFEGRHTVKILSLKGKQVFGQNGNGSSAQGAEACEEETGTPYGTRAGSSADTDYK